MSGMPGYQETPAGWIPHDWMATTLGAVADFKGGNAFKEKFQGKKAGDFPFIKVSDFSLPLNQKFICVANNWIDADTNKEIKATLFEQGAVVFAKVGAALLLNRRRVLTRKTAIDNNLMAATPRTIDPTFLYFHLQTVDFGKLVQDGAVPSVNQGQLQALPLAQPPLAEQQKIAAILTAVDDKLDVIARQIEATKTLKQGLMQTLFSRGVGTQEAVDWPTVPLCEVAEVRTGVAKGQKGLKEPAEFPYLRVANVQDGHIDLTEVKTIAVEASQYERYALRPGDVLMTEGGDFDKLGRGDVWEGQISPCLHQNHVFAVRPALEKLNSYYLAALASSDYGRRYFLSCAKRTTNLASINSSQLKAFPVLLPDLKVQERIADVVDAANSKVAALEVRQAQYQSLKRGLMQKLLKGEWRVSVDASATGT